MNYFELHIGDYQKKTAHLTLAEHGAYMLMMQTFYATEGPIPAGKTLYRMLRAESKVERDAIDSVVRQFWQKTDGGLINGRASKELADYHDFIDKQRAAGKASGVKRSLNHRSNERSTDVEPSYEPKLNGGGNQKATKRQPPTPTPTPTPKNQIQNPTHTPIPTVATGAEKDPDQGSVCGTFKKIGGDPEPRRPAKEPIPSVDEVMDQLRKEHGRAGK